MTATRDTRKKSTAQKTTTKKSAGAPKKKAPPKKKRKVLTPEQRYRQIQEAAYLKAEAQGFAVDPTQCWIEAEKEVNAQT